MFFKDKFSVGFIFVYAHLYFLKYFPTFPCYEYYVATGIFGFKDTSVQVQHASPLYDAS